MKSIRAFASLCCCWRLGCVSGCFRGDVVFDCFPCEIPRSLIGSRIQDKKPISWRARHPLSQLLGTPLLTGGLVQGGEQPAGRMFPFGQGFRRLEQTGDASNFAIRGAEQHQEKKNEQSNGSSVSVHPESGTFETTSVHHRHHHHHQRPSSFWCRATSLSKTT